MMRSGRLAQLVLAMSSLIPASATLAQAIGLSTVNTANDSKGPIVSERFALHAQSTFVAQGNFAFRAPYQGANSLDGNGDLRETWDVTVYVGAKPWAGGEIWANPEVDQGFGLRNTVGVAGFPSAEAYKVGKKKPYVRLQRLFFRQTIDLGGEAENVAGDLNQLAGARSSNRIVITMGKMGVVDVFDQNRYAHDPRGDFLNWAAVDAGSFDYAADAWGYTYGGAAELYTGRFTYRVGLFNLSKVPNDVSLETNFRQYQIDGEIEERHIIGGRPGAVRVTGFLSHGNFAKLDDAVALAEATGNPIDNAPVRDIRNRTGISVNVEQEVSDTVGVFLRAGIADGSIETIEFSDIDRTVSGGIAIAGAGWGRPKDRAGFALIANGISSTRQRFLAAGGLGILVGDGRLPHPGAELIGETYYDLAAIGSLHLAVDAQLIVNPAYNRDRGPVGLLGARIHAQF
jgi:high affinity Mn2+ porin